MERKRKDKKDASELVGIENVLLKRIEETKKKEKRSVKKIKVFIIIIKILFIYYYILLNIQMSMFRNYFWSSHFSFLFYF